MSGMDEKALVRDCLAGDELACKRLFDQYSPTMMSLCRRYATEQMEAEDCLQEGFIRVFKYLHTWKDEGQLGGWIRQIMVNVCLKQLADLKKLKLSSGYDEVIEVAVDPGPMHSMDYERLSELILTLPQGYRTVFNLSVIEGYSYTEIAAMLEIKEVTCRSQLMKAKNFLANKIKTMYPEMSI